MRMIDEGIFIHQSKYAKKLLNKFKLGECKSMCIPMHPTFVLTLDDSDKKTIFLIFSVCLCARFQFDPRESHLTTVKRIFGYIKDITDLGLLFKKSSEYRLVEIDLKEKTLVEDATSFEQTWSLGQAKDNIP
ncbi:hypothetical protein CR513_22276, partial [Mucuna pruriens]